MQAHHIPLYLPGHKSKVDFRKTGHQQAIRNDFFTVFFTTSTLLGPARKEEFPVTIQS